MLLSTLDHVPGYQVTEYLGLAQGSVVRAKHLGRDIMAEVKNIFGGELKGYSELLLESREQAIARMKEEAAALGANAIVGLKLQTTSVLQGTAELMAYGTAVRVEQIS